MAYTCNLSTQERDSGGSLWVWDSLLYIVNLRPTKAVLHLFSRKKKVSKILVGRSSYYLPKLDYLGMRPTWFRERRIPSDYSLTVTPMPWHKHDKINKYKLSLKKEKISKLFSQIWYYISDNINYYIVVIV